MSEEKSLFPGNYHSGWSPRFARLLTEGEILIGLRASSSRRGCLRSVTAAESRKIR
ncbi:MAG: hypothetical protein ACOYVJ_08140 [Nitrospirota bacterium]